MYALPHFAACNEVPWKGEDLLQATKGVPYRCRKNLQMKPKCAGQKPLQKKSHTKKEFIKGLKHSFSASDKNMHELIEQGN